MDPRVGNSHDAGYGQVVERLNLNSLVVRGPKVSWEAHHLELQDALADNNPWDFCGFDGGAGVCVGCVFF